MSTKVIVTTLAFAAVGGMPALRASRCRSRRTPRAGISNLSGQALGALALGGLALAAIASHKGGLGWTVGLLVAVLTLPLFL
jgi:hypothetical protein